jgi:PAS domain S-box-containing protein
MDMLDANVLKTMSVLYVEDDIETQDELAMMLRPWVGELHLAVDGQVGLERFKATRPDIVITDIQMPRASGLAMSADIRHLVPDQIIVVLTAFNDSEYLFRAIDLGIDQYLPKPVNVKRMVDKLAQLAGVRLASKERLRNQHLLEQYKHLVDQSAMVWVIDPVGQVTYVNDKLCEISGFGAEDLIGREFASLHHNNARGEGWPVAAAGQKWAGVSRNLTRNGEVYVVEHIMVPIMDDKQVVTEIVCMDVDITSVFDRFEGLLEALQSSHSNLREQRHFLTEYKRALALGTCVCVTDGELNIISVNRQFELLVGYAAHELKGKPLGFIAGDVSRSSCLFDAQQADPKKLTNRIVRFSARNGDELQFSVGCVAVHKLAGQLASFILICQDVTEALRLSDGIVEPQRDQRQGDAIAPLTI